VSLDWETDEGGSLTLEVADSGVDPEQSLMRDQAVFIIRKAVLALPTNLRTYASSRYLQELPHEQVAASLGISLAAGKSRSLRARQRLESSLGSMLGRLA
jgi:DNA-directed RNA polymerase specialized sigma24 family protein